MAENLRQLQMIELDILKQVLAICDKHLLTYFMLGGTLLGAVRHKGFIPWDDDIDIGMPRPDYEKFLAQAEKEIVSPYQLHTHQNGNGEYSYYYARVENTSIKVRRKAAAKTVIIPAWVDVFPLDGVPETESEFNKWNKRNRKNSLLLSLSQFEYFFSLERSKRSSNQKAAILVKKIIAYTKVYKLIDPTAAWNALDRSLKSCDYETSSRLINYCGYWGLKEMFPKSVYGKGRLYPFEDLMLNGPEDYDYVLKQMYGDYMTPPPEDQREHHYIEIIQTK